jgi:hypothetical protein
MKKRKFKKWPKSFQK